MDERADFDITDAELEAARQRGEELWRLEPRAKEAHFDRSTGRVIVELTNTCTFIFPARQAPGLETASDDQLEEITVMGDGFALHWEALNAGFTVPSLLSDVFGSRKYMAQLAGRAKSPAKAAAARANGKKGGRPRKTDQAASG